MGSTPHELWVLWMVITLLSLDFVNLGVGKKKKKTKVLIHFFRGHSLFWSSCLTSPNRFGEAHDFPVCSKKEKECVFLG